jgi:prepilin signal peptidase PulO-like enzyme (type II secretory pathway)
MLRIRRLTQLLIALCASAFLSALISFAIYRFLSMTALPLSGSSIVDDIRNLEDIGKLKEFTVLLISAAFDLRESGATLAKWGLGFVLVWSFILGTVALATYCQICKASIAPAYPEVENFIDRALAGKLELWKVFWGGYVALSLLLFFISGSILKLLLRLV